MARTVRSPPRRVRQFEMPLGCTRRTFGRHQLFWEPRVTGLFMLMVAFKIAEQSGVDRSRRRTRGRSLKLVASSPLRECALEDVLFVDESAGTITTDVQARESLRPDDPGGRLDLVVDFLVSLEHCALHEWAPIPVLSHESLALLRALRS